MAKNEDKPTLFPYPNFNSTDDAKLLREAVKGPGTDEAQIISVLCNRVNAQRQEIKATYPSVYPGRDLMKDLDDDISREFKYAVDAMMKPFATSAVKTSKKMSDKDSTYEYYADSLHQAIKGSGTDETALTDTIVTHCEIDLGNIKEVYKQKYGNTLASDVADETSGDYRSLLLELIK